MQTSEGNNMTVIVCNDSGGRMRDSDRAFWREMQSFNDYVNDEARWNLSESEMEGINWDSADPIAKARQILSVKPGLEQVKERFTQAHERDQEKRISFNGDLELCTRLKPDFEVKIWDSCVLDVNARLYRHVSDVNAAASHLSQFIKESQAMAVVYDISYFETRDYGIKILRSGKLHITKGSIFITHHIDTLESQGSSEEEFGQLLKPFHPARVVFCRRTDRSTDRVVEILCKFRREHMDV
jgi:hypothetical protein